MFQEKSMKRLEALSQNFEHIEENVEYRGGREEEERQKLENDDAVKSRDVNQVLKQWKSRHEAVGMRYVEGPPLSEEDQVTAEAQKFYTKLNAIYQQKKNALT